MELGNCCLKRNGINLLTEAVHPRHGLAWTDGRRIYLSPVKLHSGQIENEKFVKLGEFDCVESVHWGSLYELRWCYLCVVHSHSVSIWKVEGEVPKLSFKQVRKINATPISQGCLWNPCRDLLCIIGAEQCTFYYNHLHEKGSYAFPPLDSGKLACGAWNKAGTKLILAKASHLMIYTWHDIDSRITQVQPEVWPIPGVNGRVSVITCMIDDRFILTIELSLDQLCRSETGTFLVADLNQDSSVEDMSSIQNESNRPLSQFMSTDSLVKSPRSAPINGKEASETIMVDLSTVDPDSRFIARGSVKEFLSPDLIMFDIQSQCVIVGSNAQCSLQIFRIVDKKIIRIGNIILDKEVRPKGLSQIPKLSQKYCTGCLVMLGQRSEAMKTSSPGSKGVYYKLSLHFFPLPEYVDSKRNTLTRKRDSSLQNRPPSPERKNRIKQTIRSSSFIKSDYKSGKNSSQIPAEISANENSVHLNEMANGHSPVKRIHDSSNIAITKGLSKSKSDNSIFRNFIGVCKQSRNILHVSNNRHSIAEESCNSATTSDVSSVRSESIQPDSTPDLNSLDSSMDRIGAKTDSSLEYTLDDISPLLQPSPTLHHSEPTAVRRPKPRLSKGFDFKPEKKLAADKTTNISNLTHKQRSENTSNACGSRTEHYNSADTQVSIKSPSSSHRASEVYNSQISNKDNIIRDNNQSSLCMLDYKKVGQLLCNVCDTSNNLAEFNNNDNERVPDEISMIIKAQQLLQHQQDQIADLQTRIEELSKLLDKTTCVYPSKYHPVGKQDVVYLNYHQSCDGDITHTKTFLLDNGRLMFDIVRDSFQLETMEVHLGGESVVIGPNIDGYIPLKFEPYTTWNISGLPRLPDRIHSYSPKHMDTS